MCLEVILGLAKKLMIEYKQVFLILNMRFETPLKNRMGKKKKHLFWLHGDGLKELLTMNPIEKHKKI